MIDNTQNEETPESVQNDIVLGKLLQDDEKATVEQLPVNVRVWGEDELDLHKEITQSKTANMEKEQQIEAIHIMLIDHESLCDLKGIDSEEVSQSHDTIMNKIRELVHERE